MRQTSFKDFITDQEPEAKRHKAPKLRDLLLSEEEIEETDLAQKETVKGAADSKPRKGSAHVKAEPTEPKEDENSKVHKKAQTTSEENEQQGHQNASSGTTSTAVWERLAPEEPAAEKEIKDFTKYTISPRVSSIVSSWIAQDAQRRQRLETILCHPRKGMQMNARVHHQAHVSTAWLTPCAAPLQAHIL